LQLQFTFHRRRLPLLLLLSLPVLRLRELGQFAAIHRIRKMGGDPSPNMKIQIAVMTIAPLVRN